MLALFLKFHDMQNSFNFLSNSKYPAAICERLMFEDSRSMLAKGGGQTITSDFYLHFIILNSLNQHYCVWQRFAYFKNRTERLKYEERIEKELNIKNYLAIKMGNLPFKVSQNSPKK